MPTTTPVSKPAIIAAAVATACACAWAGLTTYSGRSIERNLNAKYDKLAELPFVKIRERKYDRAFASSTGEYTLTIGMPDKALPSENGAKAAFDVKIRHQIAHGPIAGSALAAARIDTEIVIPEAIRSKIDALFDDRKPLSIRTTVGFGGSSSTTLDIAPVKIDEAIAARLGTDSVAGTVNWPAGSTFDWQGMTVVSDANADQSQIDYKGRFGAVTMVEPGGGRLATSEASMEGRSKRIEGWLYDDDSRMKMQSISLDLPAVSHGGASRSDRRSREANAIRMTEIVGRTTMSVDDGYLGQKQLLEVGRLSFNDRDLGKLNYDTSVERLHLRTMIDAVKAAATPDTFACISGPDAQVPTCIEPVLAGLKTAVFEMLRHNPAFAVDRLSLTVPEGEMRIDYKLKIGAIEEADLDRPESLLHKIGISANASASEAAIGKFATMAIAGSGAGTAPPPEQLQQMIEEGSRPLVEQGFLKRADGKLSSSFDMSSGQLKINGKAIDPELTASALGALSQSGRVKRRPARANPYR